MLFTTSDIGAADVPMTPAFDMSAYAAVRRASIDNIQ